MTTTSQLDDSELLHLAIRASQNNRHDDAIGFLKQALELAPGNAKVHYMLGAEHAEIGLYDRAADEIAKAVELDPGLVTAQFQLGLLHMTSGRITEAENVWKPLEKHLRGIKKIYYSPAYCISCAMSSIPVLKCSSAGFRLTRPTIP